MFMVLAWFIWCKRNKCHFIEPDLPPDKLLDAAEVSLVEFQAKPKIRPEKTKAVAQRWNPPMQDTYKVNDLGQVMASLAEKIPMPLTVEALEAMAARRAILEGDSEPVVKALLGECSACLVFVVL